MEHQDFINEQISENNFDRVETILTKGGRVAMASDAFGREINQDRIYFDLEKDTFAVIDGMGGYDHGDIAAESVAIAMKEGIDNSYSPEQIQTRAHEIMKQSGVIKGGACYFAGRISKKKMSVWYAGDVSAVVFNQKGEIKYMNQKGSLSTVPTGQRIGQFTTDVVNLINYDRILVASDGLWDNVVAEEALKLIKTLPVAQAVKELSVLARKAMNGEIMTNGAFGNRDNLTILLYEVLPADLQR
jgi:serine/threonine protein phosphatase PrpC